MAMTILLGKECSTFLEIDDSVLQRTEVKFVWAETPDAFLPLAVEHDPDMVILDPQVNGLDAFGCARQILAAVGEGVTVLVIGNTADQERAEAAGIAGIVTRPLTQARLVEAIRRYHPVAAREAERAEVAIKADLVRGGVEVLAYTRDVATDGCFLLTHEPAAVGETLRLTLHLPITGGRDVKVEAEVVRVAAAAPDGTGAPGIALRFTTIAPADRVELGRYLRSRRRGVA
jgi:DNA-binding response OmpR family regulator